MFLSVVFILKIRLKPKEELLLHHAVLSFQTIRGLEQKSNKMYVLDMDEKGNLYLLQVCNTLQERDYQATDQWILSPCRSECRTEYNQEVNSKLQFLIFFSYRL